MDNAMVTVEIVSWPRFDTPIFSGGQRVFVLQAGGYEEMREALNQAGFIEPLGFPPPRCEYPTTASVELMMVQWPYEGAPMNSYDRRRFSLPDGDYDTVIAALKQAGFIEARSEV